MLIRDATLVDCPGIARVQVDSYRTAYASFFPTAYMDHFTYEEQESDWRELLQSDTSDIVLVAEADGGEILGYALSRAEGSEAGYDCELIALHVRRDFQRQGIGRGLMRASAERLRQAGCASLILWTIEGNSARTMYEKLGGTLLSGDKRYMVDDIEVVEVAYGWPNIEDLCRL